MKIIQITAYYPPHLGGLENVVREISERLADKGNQVEVITSDIGFKGERLTPKKNLKVSYLKSWEFAHTPIIPSLFYKLLRVPKDSIMHIHIAQAFITEIAYFISKIRKIPYITHFHGETLPTGKFGFLLPLYKIIFTKRILSSSEKVICLSEDYREFLNKRYATPMNKIEVIPNGVSEDFFMNKNKKKINIANLLYVGRLSVDKNLPILIKAASMLKSKAVLNVVGEGAMKEKLKKIILNEKSENVIIHGKKTGEELVNFYRDADIFLLASRFEGQPLTVLEAMASSTIVIASDIMGIREVVGEAGILVDSSDANNFAVEIDRIIEDEKLRNTLADLGRKKVVLNNWNEITDKIINIYKQVKKSEKIKR